MAAGRATRRRACRIIHPAVKPISLKSDVAPQTRAATGASAHLALLVVQVFFGTWPIVGKYALQALPSTGIVAFRSVGGALAFLALQRGRGRLGLTRRADYAWLGLYSLFGVVLNQFCFVKGIAYSTVINANLLGTLVPIFTLVASIALGREPFSRRTALGVLVSACGALYLVNPFRAELMPETSLGNILLLLNTFFYGTYLALTQHLIRRYGALKVITWVFLLGSFVTLPVGAYSLTHTPLGNVSAGVWLAVLYIVLVPTALCYYLNAWALGRVPPSVVAVYVYLQPLIAFALAPVLLGERLDARIWLAAALIFAGVGVVTLRRPPQTFEEVSERPDATSR